MASSPSSPDSSAPTSAKNDSSGHGALRESLHTHEYERGQAEQLNRSLVTDDVETYDKVRVIAELEVEMREAS